MRKNHGSNSPKLAGDPYYELYYELGVSEAGSYMTCLADGIGSAWGLRVGWFLFRGTYKASSGLLGFRRKDLAMKATPVRLLVASYAPNRVPIGP